VGQRGAPRVRGDALLAVLIDALTSVLLAPRCANCDVALDRPSAGPVCAPCWETVRRLVPPFCGRCGDELVALHPQTGTTAFCCSRCRGLHPSLDFGRAAADYDGALRRVIHAFKYQRRRSLARPLGMMLGLACGDMLHGASCTVPVPLHPWRRLRRGFNQAADLARTLPLPVVRAIWRTRSTAPQEHLTAAARQRNVRGAFRLSPLLTRRRRSQLITGKVVILIDDVRTTGATLEQCARVLKDAGAQEVRALTVAIARPHRKNWNDADRRG
jgi:ComF family protein